ncbi:unnamed protein product [Aphanomyces euteiches]|uniref:Uncharacterized protein n=1 Tax=Aphanomyces euteiches TaxID=100861 RepID=A0A6G0X865_9STRA|nr:hypothetical protein Ae201684_007268 [Aphanomyces euteiches]KAH9100520.1 hypothetical protein Ae201684P_006717 [Aphanomyces euteiches]KAH9132746.1 hypothetical protein AeRB84_020968 [Aphanomyces euteiches]
MSALDKNRPVTRNGVFPREEQFMEILRQKRIRPDEDDDITDTPDLVKKRLATFSTDGGAPAPPFSLPLPKINPVVLVLKKKPLECDIQAPVPSHGATSTSSSAPPTSAASTNPMLQADKLQSVIRGLVHFSQCPEGCPNKLCQSTTAFVNKVRNHLRTQPITHDRSACGACKLWTMIVNEHKKECQDPQCSIPLCKRSIYM